MNAVVNQFYRKNGFTFRVDFINDKNEVYVVRWKGDSEWGTGMRFPKSLWDKEMFDAELIDLEKTRC